MRCIPSRNSIVPAGGGGTRCDDRFAWYITLHITRPRFYIYIVSSYRPAAAAPAATTSSCGTLHYTSHDSALIFTLHHRAGRRRRHPLRRRRLLRIPFHSIPFHSIASSYRTAAAAPAATTASRGGVRLTSRQPHRGIQRKRAAMRSPCVRSPRGHGGRDFAAISRRSPRDRQGVTEYDAAHARARTRRSTNRRLSSGDGM